MSSEISGIHDDRLVFTTNHVTCSRTVANQRLKGAAYKHITLNFFTKLMYFNCKSYIF